MVIRLKEDTNNNQVNRKEIYYTVYEESNDITFIMKDVLIRKSDNTWIDESESCVGWHWGTPSKDTENYIGKLTATYNNKISEEVISDIITLVDEAGDLLKVVES